MDVKPISRVAAIHSVGADGNCGFRAVAFDVYKDKKKWVKVKQDMLQTYLKYKDTLYQAVGTDTVVKYEEQKMMAKLKSTLSPCLGKDYEHMWFSTFTCPQVVADTYQRPVIVATYLEAVNNSG